LLGGGSFLRRTVLGCPLLRRPSEALLGSRLRLRRSAMRATEERCRRPFMFGRMRFGRNIDDRVLLRPKVWPLVGVDPAAGNTAPARRLVLGFDRRTGTEVGVEKVLEIGPQCGELGAQRGHLVGGLGTYLGGELAT